MEVVSCRLLLKKPSFVCPHSTSSLLRSVTSSVAHVRVVVHSPHFVFDSCVAVHTCCLPTLFPLPSSLFLCRRLQLRAPASNVGFAAPAAAAGPPLGPSPNSLCISRGLPSTISVSAGRKINTTRCRLGARFAGPAPPISLSPPGAEVVFLSAALSAVASVAVAVASSSGSPDSVGE